MFVRMQAGSGTNQSYDDLAQKCHQLSIELMDLKSASKFLSGDRRKALEEQISKQILSSSTKTGNDIADKQSKELLDIGECLADVEQAVSRC